MFLSGHADLLIPHTAHACSSGLPFCWLVGVVGLGSRNAVDEKTVLIIPKIWFVVVVVVRVWGVKEPNRCTHFSETYIPMELSNESCDEDCQHLGRAAPSGLFRKRVLCYMFILIQMLGMSCSSSWMSVVHTDETQILTSLGQGKILGMQQQGRPGKLRSFRSVRCKMMIVGCEIGGARKVEQPSEIQTANCSRGVCWCSLLPQLAAWVKRKI